MAIPHLNDVALVGRLSGEPRRRSLPSGDELVSWRLVVERAPERDRRPRVDTIPCVSFAPAIRALAPGWRHGDVIEVRGALRRRFWRSAGGGAADRCEVEVREAELIAVAPHEPARPAPPGDRASAAGAAAGGTTPAGA